MVTSAISVILFTSFVQGTTAQILATKLGLTTPGDKDDRSAPSDLTDRLNGHSQRSPSVYMEQAASPRTGITKIKRNKENNITLFIKLHSLGCGEMILQTMVVLNVSGVALMITI